MSKHLIELSAEVEPEKRRSVSAVRGAFEEIMAEVTGSSPALLHEVEARLFGQVMRLGVLLMLRVRSLWMGAAILNAVEGLKRVKDGVGAVRWAQAGLVALVFAQSISC